MHEEETLTAVGDIPGTLAYISPERLKGKPAGPAADVWAVGVLLWEALAGEHPFWGGSLLDTAKRIESGAPSLGSDAARPRPTHRRVRRPRAQPSSLARRPSAAALAGGCATVAANARTHRRRAAPAVADARAGRCARRCPPATAFLFAAWTARRTALLPCRLAVWIGLAAGAARAPRTLGSGWSSRSPSRCCRSGTTRSRSPSSMHVAAHRLDRRHVARAASGPAADGRATARRRRPARLRARCSGCSSRTRSGEASRWRQPSSQWRRSRASSRHRPARSRRLRPAWGGCSGRLPRRRAGDARRGGDARPRRRLPAHSRAAAGPWAAAGLAAFMIAGNADRGSNAAGRFRSSLAAWAHLPRLIGEPYVRARLAAEPDTPTAETVDRRPAAGTRSGGRGPRVDSAGGDRGDSPYYRTQDRIARRGRLRPCVQDERPAGRACAQADEGDGRPPHRLRLADLRPERVHGLSLDRRPGAVRGLRGVAEARAPGVPRPAREARGLRDAVAARSSRSRPTTTSPSASSGSPRAWSRAVRAEARPTAPATRRRRRRWSTGRRAGGRARREAGRGGRADRARRRRQATPDRQARDRDRALARDATSGSTIANISRRHAELRQQGTGVLDRRSRLDERRRGEREPRGAGEARGRRHGHARRDRSSSSVEPLRDRVDRVRRSPPPAQDRLPRRSLPLHLADRAHGEPRPAHAAGELRARARQGAQGACLPRSARAGGSSRVGGAERRVSARLGGDHRRSRRRRTTFRSTTTSRRRATRESSPARRRLDRGRRLDERHVRQRRLS